MDCDGVATGSAAAVLGAKRLILALSKGKGAGIFVPPLGNPPSWALDAGSLQIPTQKHNLAW